MPLSGRSWRCSSPSAASSSSLDGVLVGAGDFRFLLWSTVVAFFGALVPLTLLALRLGWGLEGIWVAITGLMLVRLAANSWRLIGRRWQVVGAPAS